MAKGKGKRPDSRTTEQDIGTQVTAGEWASKNKTVDKTMYLVR
jgi:hypothetical protein